MVFSSLTFLYYFLPILLMVYFLIPNKYRNIILLIFSLAFYIYGEPKYIIILLLSCIVNYIASKLMIKHKKYKKIILVLALIYNIGQLFYFKYMDFFLQNINSLFGTNIALFQIIMPLGISFFTFQAISYIVDVYKGKVKPANNFLKFATYLTLFPQLVAGPIVRYEEVETELNSRKHSFDLFASGVKRFVIGLSKKVIIANTLGMLCSSLSNMEVSTVVSSWLNAISFTLQIYFDFSGYSDMAIGLGLMFGFHILENFNYPLIAKSITDFWRRWHISLSSFFKDYVYIPLGGNRVSILKWIRNIFIVWFLTGFWHGAAWNFILWGIYFAILLMIEKLFIGKYLEKTKCLKYIYTILLVIISFTIFNANSLNEVILNLKNMFFLNNLNLWNNETFYYIRSYGVILILAIICSTPLLKNILHKLQKKVPKIVDILEPITILGLSVVITSYLVDSSFNPFLYFRF